jgi:predicted transposase YbfD/YdcC
MEGNENRLKGLVSALRGVNDPRIERSKLYPLNEVLFLCVSAVISGYESWDEIVDFGEEKLSWLRSFLPFENGVPSHDTLNRVVSLIDYRSFEKSFIDWATMGISLPNGVQICIDGKKIRRSATKLEQQTPHTQGGKSAVHLVHAWCNELELCLGQYKTKSKSNEITAIPALLDLLEIGGSIITIDAMGCQKKIAEKIVEKKGEYIFGLKGNQGNLSASVTEVFKDEKHSSQVQQEISHSKGHGRKEERICRVLSADILPESAQISEWKNLESIIEICSKREIMSTGKIETEKRYYISSLRESAPNFNALIRSHWGVENKLHWTMDVLFGEDQSRKRVKNAAENFSTIRKIVLNLIKASPEKISVNRKRKKCALSDQYRESVIQI